MEFIVCVYAASCPNGKIRHTCGTACPLTCDNYMSTPLTCTYQCVNGCFCPDGMVELEDECVNATDCPESKQQQWYHNLSFSEYK